MVAKRTSSALAACANCGSRLRGPDAVAMAKAYQEIEALVKLCAVASRERLQRCQQLVEPHAFYRSGPALLVKFPVAFSTVKTGLCGAFLSARGALNSPKTAVAGPRAAGRRRACSAPSCARATRRARRPSR
jgi:hypothetical protein